MTFASKRIVEWRNFGAPFDPGFHAGFARKIDLRQQTGAGLEILAGIFRIDPHLDGMPCR